MSMSKCWSEFHFEWELRERCTVVLCQRCNPRVWRGDDQIGHGPASTHGGDRVGSERQSQLLAVVGE
jgi:hypothetical protein